MDRPIGKRETLAVVGVFYGMTVYMRHRRYSFAVDINSVLETKKCRYTILAAISQQRGQVPGNTPNRRL